MSVKTIAATKAQKNFSGLLDAVDQGTPFYIISRHGRQKYAIIDLAKLEDLLAVGDPGYLKDIAQARRQVAAGEIFSTEEVFGNL